MFFKLVETSSLYKDLYDALMKDRERLSAFIKWMDINLPPHDERYVTQQYPLHQFAKIVGWWFNGEVDRETWRPLRGFMGYYEPNIQTYSGRAMHNRISEACGVSFCRLRLFDFFKINIPDGLTWKIPKSFIGTDNVVYVFFDDIFYSDLCKNWEGHFVEITHSEWITSLDLLHNDRRD